MDPIEESLREEMRAAYLSACNRRTMTQKARCEEEIRLGEEHLRECSRAIVEETRAARENRGKLTYLRAWQVTEAARHREEFQRLLQLSDVVQVRMRDDVLQVFTRTLYAEHKGIRYELGDFRIDIHFEGYVMAHNVRNCGRDATYDHPHIKRGAICMGNVREGIVKLIGEYQFSVVTQIMIDFLRTYNESDAHCPITLWRESPVDGA